MNYPRTRLDHSFGIPFVHNLSRLSQSGGSCSNGGDQEFVQFRPNSQLQEVAESDDSGVCSPPLWKSSPSPSQPLLSSHRDLSPDSRIRAITRGQRELMEMVKNMPESSYELSLKDLVEHDKVEAQNLRSKNQNLHRRAAVKVKRQESKKNEKNLLRIESFEDKRLFLKMVFPFPLKSKRKKNSVSNSKPETMKGGGGGERDWWKKKFTGSSDSDSSGMSNNSGSTGSSGSSSSDRSDGGGGRKTSGLLRSCCPFFHSRSSKPINKYGVHL